jgi:hypothetical protein
MRCGSPSARRTNIELWGNAYGKKLFLPDGIERIAAQIPKSANLTTEKFISDTTIFPLLKPFLPETKAVALFNDMKHGNSNIYNGIGFSHVFRTVQRHLRYCECCVADDTKKYGEAYWHRLHQFPGIYVCHKHSAALTESEIELADIRGEYYLLLPAVGGAQLSLVPESVEKLFAIACDFDWIAQNGEALGYYEDTLECYNKWLCVRGYRANNGKTTHKKLAEALVSYYGQEFLSIFDAYNSGACLWIRKITTHNESLQHPVLHILLMRFLAGSMAEFFAGTNDGIPEYKPYGSPSYPCRNVVCEYHLQDVIGSIEVIRTQKGSYKATFICPHCGFTYRRKTPIPKEKQYAGQIDVIDYGWLWHEKLKEMLAAKVSINNTAKVLRCDTRTVVKLGIELDYFPPEQYPKLRPYVAHPKAEAAFDERREHYRKRWLDVISSKPDASRNELRIIDSKTDQWLHLNDADWYEKNSPPSQKFQPKWADDDKIYAERIENAMNRIRDAPGRPKRISISAIGRMLGDEKLHRKLASGRLPISKALIDAKAESHEDWQRRRIIWAIQDMRGRGEVVTVYKVRHHATIEDKERKWDDFITQNIINSE